MKIILSHPTGNANVRAAASALAEQKMLLRFFTTLAVFPGSLLDKLGAVRPFAEIRRRRYDMSLKPITQTFPWREALRLTASKVGCAKLLKHETGPLCIDAVYRNLDYKVGFGLKQKLKTGADAVYAYEDGAKFTFGQAKSLGIKCLYDLPTGYWRSAKRILSVEKERWPEWSDTISGFADSKEKLVGKDVELSLADHIFVASKFTAKTLEEYPGKLAPVEIIPYGFPPIYNKKYYNQISSSNPLKLLFVGKLSQQKGLADLFAAIEPFECKVQLTLIGQKVSGKCNALDHALAKHSWIPTLNHDAILKCMREHDVLVFPSLFDGFGLVISEAMSQGTPVIASDRSAGPDLINHDQNGWIIEAGSIISLKNTIEDILSCPQKIKKASLEAIQTANLRPWNIYKKELTESIRRHSSDSNKSVI